MTDPSACPQHDSSALDRLRRFGGDKLLSEMISLFREHAVARLDAARAALAAGEVAGVRASLHALKSSAAQLGATRLSLRCAAGEAMAEEGKIDTLVELVDAATHDLAEADAWLLAALPAHTPPDA